VRPAGWAALTELAAAQHSLVSLAQARELGIGDSAVRRALAAGRLVPVRRGVLAVGGAALSPAAPVMAACLAAGPGAVASYRSAGALHGLAVAAPAEPEISWSAATSRGLDRAGRHRTRRLPEEHCTVALGVPCTTVERTIIDLAAVLGAAHLVRLVDDAERRHLVRRSAVTLALAQVTTRGRTGVARLRTILDDAVVGASPLEATWLRHVRDAGLPAPTLQHQLVLRGRVVLLDAAWPDRRVGLEVDGFGPHRTPTAFADDADRANLLVEAGWRTVRATARSDPDRVTGQLRRLLAA